MFAKPLLRQQVGTADRFFYLLGYCLGLWAVAAMFQYSMWTFFMRDVPWYADILGGVALSLAFYANFVIFAISVIIRCLGIELPIFEI